MFSEDNGLAVLGIKKSTLKKNLWNIKTTSRHSQTVATWRMHTHAHGNLYTYPKYTRLSCLYFLLLMSPWSRIILRICSGGMSSFWASTNPNFLFSENLLDCSCCHFCAAKIYRHVNQYWTLLLSTLTIPSLCSLNHATKCSTWHKTNEKVWGWIHSQCTAKQENS